MPSFRYRVVDVFTTEPLAGNPLAVFPEASGLDDVTMQRIAREMNLSETVFIFPSAREECVATLRIFTPSQEMLFAGHPTIGASFVLLDEGVVTLDREHFVLDEKIGPVPIRIEKGERPRIWLRTPPIHWGQCYDRSLAAEAIGLAPSDLRDVIPQLLSAGNPTIYIAVNDKAAVDRAWPDPRGLSVLQEPNQEVACFFVFTPTGEGAYSRMFAPEYGIVEDPATGSSTGPLAAFMMRHHMVSGASGTMFISEQGVRMGRRSILYVAIHGENGAAGIDVGGYVASVADAKLTLS